MKYLSVVEIAKKWGLSERTVRNYCATSKIPNVVLKGKTWFIPEESVRPSRTNKSLKPRDLLTVLKEEKSLGIRGGIYHKIQVMMTYNSNHIEGSTLTQEQTRLIYETRGVINNKNSVLNVDDLLETMNHFRCIDMVIDYSKRQLSETFIKKLHSSLKQGTCSSLSNTSVAGEYKKFPNEVSSRSTTPVELVDREIKKLLSSYNKKKTKTLFDLVEFHVLFERIHPFQDGNGRVGRLILLKECLRYNIVPFIITGRIKLFYYRGLDRWSRDKGYLMDTCLSCQDEFKKYLDYFKIKYKDD